MTSGTSQHRSRSFTLALYVNAALLAAILLSLLNSRGRSPLDSISLNSTAFGQIAQPIAGGAGFYLMPAQFSTNSWGCYVMDVDAQTLVCYVYDSAKPGNLRLVAARSFALDRQLRSYNTSPSPYDVQQVIEQERDTARRPEELNPATKPTVPNE
jgi:hypothetical protein